MAIRRSTYFVVFGVLAVLTGAELALKFLALSRGWMISGLITLALAKALLVALFFMHLRYETRSLKLLVGLPMLLPVGFAVVLVLESIARSAFS
jgi:cytochrome c oxidase subunit 4